MNLRLLQCYALFWKIGLNESSISLSLSIIGKENRSKTSIPPSARGPAGVTSCRSARPASARLEDAEKQTEAEVAKLQIQALQVKWLVARKNGTKGREGLGWFCLFDGSRRDLIIFLWLVWTRWKKVVFLLPKPCFIDAFSHLYKRVCSSVHRSVCPSVGSRSHSN